MTVSRRFYVEPTAVDKGRAGKKRDVNVRFSSMVSRHRIWQRLPSFGSLEALNDWLTDQCALLWQQMNLRTQPLQRPRLVR